MKRLANLAQHWLRDFPKERIRKGTGGGLSQSASGYDWHFCSIVEMIWMENRLFILLLLWGENGGNKSTTNHLYPILVIAIDVLSLPLIIIIILRPAGHPRRKE